MSNPYLGCIELDTPQTIMDDGNFTVPAGTDIFAEVFGESVGGFVNSSIMQQALWWKWRDYCIASCDTDKWIRGMTDRLNLIGHKWDDIISKAYEEDTDLTSIVDRGYTRIVDRKGTDTNVSTPSGRNTSTSEHESLPQTVTGSTRYLDTRDTLTDTPGVTMTDQLTHNTQDTETYIADDSITAVTFSDMIQNYPNVLLGFTDEFRDFFIERWYL